MNRTFVVSCIAISTFAAGRAMADEVTPPRTQPPPSINYSSAAELHSGRTRAQVRAEYIAARDAGTLPASEEIGAVLPAYGLHARTRMGGPPTDRSKAQ